MTDEIQIVPVQPTSSALTTDAADGPPRPNLPALARAVSDALELEGTTRVVMGGVMITQRGYQAAALALGVQPETDAPVVTTDSEGNVHVTVKASVRGLLGQLVHAHGIASTTEPTRRRHNVAQLAPMASRRAVREVMRAAFGLLFDAHTSAEPIEADAQTELGERGPDRRRRQTHTPRGPRR